MITEVTLEIDKPFPKSGEYEHNFYVPTNAEDIL